MYQPHRLDPDLAPYAAPMTDWLKLEDIPAARAGLEAMLGQLAAQAPEFPDIETHDERVPGPKKAPDIMLRVYRPQGHTGRLPVVYYIHGGGMVLGSVPGSDVYCKNLCRSVVATVVSVEYRLAPEHPYPAPLEDCYAGLLWLSENAGKLNVDAKRIAIMGDSAGGGLATGLGLLARDRKKIKIAFQALIYPMIDDRNVKSARVAKGDHYVWSRANNKHGWQAYLGRKFGTASVPVYAAPARAKNVAGLPPTYICSGDMDLFLKEDMALAGKLMAAHVPVELHIYPGAFHGFDSLAGTAEISQRATADIARALRRALA